jgi:predicted KAP-like P-loop ATPase
VPKDFSPQKFSDDSPKKNPWSEDRLGYKPFAERIAKAVLNLHAPNGYVIGLHGAWGSGKSTALNFVQAFLEKHNSALVSG